MAYIDFTALVQKLKPLSNNMIRFSWILIIAFVWPLEGCKNRVYVDPIENINKGEITILCDQDLEYVMKQQGEVYEGLFDGSKINFTYLSEPELMKALYNREAQVAVIGRRMTEKERKDLQAIDTIIPREHLVASDALAIIVGKQSPIRKISYADFIAGLNSAKPTYHYIFESKQSGLLQSFDFFKNAKNPTAFFGMDSLDALIDYLQKNENAMGFISFSKISDSDNERAKEILKKVNIVYVEIQDSTGKKIDTRATQADIAEGLYPFVRPINYILLNPKERIGIGFANHLHRPGGSKLFLKTGLIPARMPERDFIINNERIKTSKN